MALFIGLMSGTSLDGIDGVLADWSADGRMTLRAEAHRAMPGAWHDELLALNRPGADELHRSQLAANALAELYAQTVQDLLGSSGHAPTQVRAIGAHGQTVRHRPGEFDGIGYTVQLLNGALLAERCGIDVICDLRSRDVAAGGQGAPLVPAFHASQFGRRGSAQAVLNLGGIGNLSLLRSDGSVGGFDCGPGNVLMDLWCARHLERPHDADGNWAATGRVSEDLLDRFLAETYFARQPPKSTGRDLFHAAWLDDILHRCAAQGLAWAPADVQATLAELTVRSAGDALQRHLPGVQRLLVCGGGALNAHVMRRLALSLPGVTVQSSDQAGLPPLLVEAAAFAWLARAFVERNPGNRPEVTGATGPRILGALHPAG
jgi:anhydro-N-acetylmuramic acid kinase